jgi:lipopolysaccharide transport system ATP-binding protein
MRDVATSGRTVLLVSHNMAAVSSLCSRAVVLHDGRLVFAGDPGEAVARYSAQRTVMAGDLRGRHDRQGSGEIRAVAIGVHTVRGEEVGAVPPLEPFDIVVDYEASDRLKYVAVSIDIEQIDGTRIATLFGGFRNQSFAVEPGPGRFSCRIDGLPLRPDTYSLNVFIGGQSGIYDFVERAMLFDVAPADVFGTGRLPERSQGPLIVEYNWTASAPVAAG